MIQAIALVFGAGLAIMALGYAYWQGYEDGLRKNESLIGEGRE
jgi:hypothetical protein